MKVGYCCFRSPDVNDSRRPRRTQTFNIQLTADCLRDSSRRNENKSTNLSVFTLAITLNRLLFDGDAPLAETVDGTLGVALALLVAASAASQPAGCPSLDEWFWKRKNKNAVEQLNKRIKEFQKKRSKLQAIITAILSCNFWPKTKLEQATLVTGAAATENKLGIDGDGDTVESAPADANEPAAGLAAGASAWFAPDPATAATWFSRDGIRKRLVAGFLFSPAIGASLVPSFLLAAAAASTSGEPNSTALAKGFPNEAGFTRLLLLFTIWLLDAGSDLEVPINDGRSNDLVEEAPLQSATSADGKRNHDYILWLVWLIQFTTRMSTNQQQQKKGCSRAWNAATKNPPIKFDNKICTFFDKRIAERRRARRQGRGW